MIREKTHELGALEKWLTEMLQEDVFEPTATTERARARRDDLEKRAKLAKVAIEPLLDHVIMHSPQLGKLVEKVFLSQEKVVQEAIKSFRDQKSTSQTLAENMKGLVSFSEKQLRKNKHRAELASKRAADYKTHLETNQMSLRLLQTEHQEARKKVYEYESLLKGIEDRTEEDLNWSLDNNPNTLFEDVLGNLEQERRRKLKTLEKMDNLFDTFEADHLSALENQSYATKVATMEKEVQLDVQENQADVLEHLVRVRGRVSEGLTDESPPSGTPKKWRAGWYIPYPLRCQMSNFQPNRRVLLHGSFMRLIMQVYAFKLSGGEDSAEADDNRGPGKRRSSLTRGEFSLGGVTTSKQKKSTSLAEALYQLMGNTYGLNKLCDWHVAELVNSCKHFQDHKRINLFSFLLGVQPKLCSPCKSDTQIEMDEEVTQQPQQKHKLLSEQVTTTKGSNKSDDKKKQKKDPFANLYTKVPRSSDRLCEDFVFDLLERLSNYAELPSLANSQTEQIYVQKATVVQVVNQMCEDWKGPNAGQLICSLNQLREVTGPVSPAPAGSPTPNSKGPRAPKKRGKVPVTIESTTETPSGTRGVAKVDLDEVLFLLASSWISHEAAWRKRLASVFVKHCRLMRYVFGMIVSCKSIDNDIAEKTRILRQPKANRAGYFAVMDQDGFRAALRSMDVTANKRQVATFFEQACQEHENHTQRKSEAIWLKATSTRASDQGRSYYINQISNERVWDTRPLFHSEVDELMRPSPMSEIDEGSFISFALQNKWDAKL